MDRPSSEARERVLHLAEQLFSERGYKAVTLRDIADALGMKPASLYNHAPGGKQELFTAVTERNLARHQAGLQAALQYAAPDIRAQLRAVADWLLSQPPTNLQRMTHSDMPALAPAEAQRLSRLAYESLVAPVLQAVERAAVRGEIALRHVAMLTTTFVGGVEGLRDLEPYTHMSQSEMVTALIDLVLQGAYPR